MNVNPGELNKKIEIVLIEKDKNTSGFMENKKETVVRKPYAKVTKTSIREAVLNSSEMAVTKCRFLVRYTDVQITNKMFIKYKGLYYHIEYVNDYEDAHEYIEIMTGMGVPHGNI